MWEAYLSVSWMESLHNLFFPVVQSQAAEQHDSLDSMPFQIYIVAVCVLFAWAILKFYDVGVILLHCVFLWVQHSYMLL